MRKAQTASYDYAIKALLRLADGRSANESRPRNANVNVVYAIGLGSFDSQTGLASKHSALQKRFIIRVSILSY